MNETANILIVDDEPGMRDMLSYELGAKGYRTASAGNGLEALEKLKTDKFHLLITDIKMPKLGGLELLSEAKKLSPDMEVIVSTGYGTIETAVDAMKNGAYDFVQKPFNLDELFSVVDKALERTELKRMLSVYETGQAIFSSIKLDEILPVMSGLAAKILKTDDAAILLADEKGKFNIAASFGLQNAEEKESRLAFVTAAISGWTAETAPVLYEEHSAGDPRFANIAGLAAVHAAIIYPLVTEKKLLGVLTACRVKNKNLFQPADLRYAGLFCSQISQAIHNAGLYRALDENLREIKSMQELLIESEKLAAIGKLAAGVAHEINNPLTGIMGFAELLLQSDKLAREHREDVESILQQSQRCRRIVQNLLQFSRKKDFGSEAVNLSVVVQAAIQLTKHDFTSLKIELVTDFPEDLPLVTGNTVEFEQVFINLLNNSRQALTGVSGGEIKIAAVRKGERVLVSFADNGSGIPPENIGKIFDPFFTTKPVGQGTGLGLSISYSSLRRHNAGISVKSEQGKGTVFTLDFIPHAIDKKKDI